MTEVISTVDEGWALFKELFEKCFEKIKVPFRVVEDMNQRLVEIKKVGSNLQLFYHFSSPWLAGITKESNCHSASIYTKSINQVTIKPIITDNLYSLKACEAKLCTLMLLSRKNERRVEDPVQFFWHSKLSDCLDEQGFNIWGYRPLPPDSVLDFDNFENWRILENPQTVEELVESALATIRHGVKSHLDKIQDEFGEFVEISISYSGSSMPLLVCSNTENAYKLVSRLKTMLASDAPRLVDTYTAADVGSPMQITSSDAWYDNYGQYNSVLREYAVSSGIVDLENEGQND